MDYGEKPSNSKAQSVFPLTTRFSDKKLFSAMLFLKKTRFFSKKKNKNEGKKTITSQVATRFDAILRVTKCNPVKERIRQRPP